MKEMTREQFDRLPLFAKNEIRRLRLKVESLKAKNDLLEKENRMKSITDS